MKTFLAAASGACLLVAGGAHAADPTVNVNLYGDFDYIGYRMTPKGSDTAVNSSTFSLPRVTTLFSASLGRLTLINENTFNVPIFSNTSNSFEIDVERFEISYQVAEWLRFKAGRFHSAFGYYNDAYHSGFYYQLGVDRPGFTRFEDGGGLIPARAIGIHADGRFTLGEAGAIRYDVEVQNSRGATLSSIPNRQDLSNSKAVDFRLRFEPAFLEGLILGANYYFSDIPGSTQIVGLNPATGAPIEVTIPRMHEQILGAHVAYVEGKIHLIAEFAHFIHTVKGTEISFTTDAGFVEAGYAVGDFTPYVVFEKSVLPGTPGAVSDPYLALSVAGAVGSNRLYRGGVKWQVADGLALKLELAHVETDLATFNAVTSQAAVAF